MNLTSTSFKYNFQKYRKIFFLKKESFFQTSTVFVLFFNDKCCSELSFIMNHCVLFTYRFACVYCLPPRLKTFQDSLVFNLGVERSLNVRLLLVQIEFISWCL